MNQQSTGHRGSKVSVVINLASLKIAAKDKTKTNKRTAKKLAQQMTATPLPGVLYTITSPLIILCLLGSNLVFALELTALNTAFSYQKSHGVLSAQLLKINQDTGIEIEQKNTVGELTLANETLHLQLPEHSWQLRQQGVIDLFHNTNSIQANIARLYLTPTKLQLSANHLAMLKNNQIHITDAIITCHGQGAGNSVFHQILDNCLTAASAEIKNIDSKKLRNLILPFAHINQKDTNIKQLFLGIHQENLIASLAYNSHKIFLRAIINFQGDTLHLQLKKATAKYLFFTSSIKGHILRKLGEIKNPRLSVKGDHVYYRY